MAASPAAPYWLKSCTPVGSELFSFPKVAFHVGALSARYALIGFSKLSV